MRREKGENLRAQATDSSAVSNHDLSGKGAKLGYYILVCDYVYVVLVFLMFSIGLSFRSKMVESLGIDVFTDGNRNKLRSCIE